MSLQKSLIAKIHDIKNEKKVNLMNCMENGSATAKDKVNLTLDVITVIGMPAFVIKESVVFDKNLDNLSIYTCHPYAEAKLIFSVSFQFHRMSPKGYQILCYVYWRMCNGKMQFGLRSNNRSHWLILWGIAIPVGASFCIVEDKKLIKLTLNIEWEIIIGKYRDKFKVDVELGT